MNRGLLAGVAAFLIFLTACGSDAGEDSAGSAAGPTSTMAPLVSATVPDSVPVSTAATDATSELIEFCRLAQATDDELPESFIGTAAHVEMIDALAGAAPSEIRPQLEGYSDYLGSGAIDPEDPETKDTENWPADVRTGIFEAQDYITANC